MTNEFGNCEVCGAALSDSSGVCKDCLTQGLGQSDFLQIPGLQCIRKLGAGGMGAVYLARDEELGRFVAVKEMAPEYSASEEARVRFRREARAMATVEHPNVVRVYSFGEVDEKLYIVMEYVDGETLADRLRKEGKFPVDQALAIIRQVVEALRAGWKRKIVHRDIKPTNILIDNEGMAHVADFGLAKPVRIDEDTTLTRKGYLLGTPQYSSPEQARGEKLDFRSDVYSLGIVLYELLAGEKPFTGQTPFSVVDQHLHDPLPDLGHRRPDVPAGVITLIGLMTAKRPEERCSSFGELLEAIDTAPIDSCGETAQLEARPLSGRERWLARGATVFFTILILVLGILALKSLRSQIEPRGSPDLAVAEDPARFVVAVAPFYGPDEDSVKEGLIIASLVEKAIEERLPGQEVAVLGLDQIPEPVKSHDEARRVGENLGATVVVWGEALALRGETELQPFITTVPKPTARTTIETPGRVNPTELMNELGFGDLQPTAPTTRVRAGAPNQIELRRVSAGEIGDMVLVLAGFHALAVEQNPSRALSILDRAPRNEETLGMRARAASQLGRSKEAVSMLEEALNLGAGNAQSLALLGDLLFDEDNLTEAVAAYKRAAEASAMFSTQHAVVFDGLFYQGERYKSEALSDGEPVYTCYLLGKDPDSARVLQRFFLPGIPVGFRHLGDELEISYAPEPGRPALGAIRLRDGELTRPAYYPGFLLSRIRSMRSGFVIPANFIEHPSVFDNPFKASTDLRFQPTTSFSDAPVTYAALEKELLRAAADDPTQPWHVFWLSQCYRAQGDLEPAEEYRGRLMNKQFPGTPYFEFAWMARFAELLDQPDFSEELFGSAMKIRAEINYSIEWSYLIERLINFPVLRVVARSKISSVQTEYAYAWLQRARQITGISEYDDIVAAAWKAYFSSVGDVAKANEEESVIRRIRSSPLDLVRPVSECDFSIFLVLSSVTSLWFVLFWLSMKPKPAATGEHPTTQHSIFNRSAERAKRAWTVINRVRYLRATGFSLAVAGALWGIAAGFVWISYGRRHGESVPGSGWAVAAIFAVFIAWRLKNVGIAAYFSQITRRDLIVVGASLTLGWTSCLLLSGTTLKMGGLFSLPIGIGDSPAAPRAITALDNHLEKRWSSPDLRYAAAVAHHANGDLDKARELYRSLGNNSRARSNLELLERGEQFDRESFGPSDFLAAFAATPLDKALHLLRLKGPERALSSLGYYDRDPGGLSLAAYLSRTVHSATLIFLLIVIGVMSFRPHADAGFRRARGSMSRLRRIMCSLVPGSYVLGRGSSLWGWGILTAFLLSIATGYAYISASRGLPVTGWVGHIMLPNLEDAFPFPPISELSSSAYDEYYWPIFWSYPYARIFVCLLLAATIFWVTSHALTLRQIWCRRDPSNGVSDSSSVETKWS